MKTENLRKKQAGYKIRLLKWMQEIRQLCTDNASRSMVRNALKELEKQFDKVQLLQEELEEGLSLDDLEKEIDEFRTLEQEILEIRSIAEDFIEEMTDGKKAEIVKNGSDVNVSVRLPRHELPKFHGDVLEFTAFWEQFEDCIHMRRDISDSAKFSYLRSSLSGSALAAINGLSLTAANYPAAIAILKNRFGRKDVVIQSHIRKLLEVEPCVKTSAENLQVLHDELNLHVRALGALGKDLNSSRITAAEILMELFKLKLPITIRKKWEEEIFTDETKGSDLDVFFSFLLKQVRIEQSVVKTQTLGQLRLTKAMKTTATAERVTTTSALKAKIEPRLNSCAVCNGEHTIFQCEQFLRATPDERWSLCSKRGLCYHCLYKGHLANRCSRRKPCGEAGCTLNHHRLLHQPGTKEMTPMRDQIAAEDHRIVEDGKTPDHAVLLAKSKTRKNILLQTANAFIENEDGECQMVMCLLDTGCQQSLVRKKIANQLGLKGHFEHVKITRLGDSCGQHKRLQRVKFRLKDVRNNREGLSMEALCVPTICKLSANPNLKDWKYLQSFDLADQFPRPAAEIDVLIGMDFYHKFATNETIKSGENGPHAMESSLGWILSGPIATNADEGVVMFSEIETENDDETLQKFWRLDSMGIQEPSNEVHGTNSFLKDSIHYDGNRYVVELPWINNMKMLPDNFELAWTRLQQTERYKGISLNEYLDAGPALQSDMVGVLLRFRLYSIAVQADIMKMFLQIGLKEKDRDVTRFLWKDPSKDKLHVYRFNRVCFGLTCSPFLAMAVIRHHAELKKEVHPEAAQIVENNIYVDDVLLSVENQEAARRMIKDLNNLMESGGFKLAKWASNDSSVLSDIAVDKRATTDNREILRTLGLHWNRERDEFTFVALITENEKNCTKRKLISDASKLYDPLGFLTPFVVRAKILFQKLWQAGIDWDEPLTTSIAEDWSKWKREAKNLWKIKIPRCLIPSPVEETDSTELHVYGDASKWAYGAVAYLKVISKDKTTVRFIMSKSRVAPLKTITLPRLELMAALIAAKLVSFIKNSLAIPIQRVICWTDSQIALSWIRSEAKNWKPFVKNRVELIQQLTEPKLWKYCPSENNPADLISRGTSVTKLKDSRLWWEGPPSLLNPESCEKTSDEYTQHPDALEERSLFSGISSINDDQYEYVIDPSRFQTFSKLARVTAWCLRFVKNCRHPSKQRQEELTIEELNESELYWMKTVQNETFRDEKSLLMKGKLSENSRLIHLTPFIDEFGVMRVGGRLQQSNLLYQHKHPTILPNKHNITDLIIQGEHKHQWHAGVEQTLAALRKRFWILKGRSAVKRVLRRCVVCRKENARCLNQIMAPLPKNRLVETHAFDNVGIDFAGPLYVKEGRTISKIYICLFTCMATRAIHLEPTSDMTTQSFLAAFRRFISRRGKPSVVQTDNFRTFKLADKYIQDLFRGDEKQKIARAMTEEKIEWRFSCERAPWCGGYWERLVRSVKTALRKVLAKALVSREELVTILCEIEARINARPLTTISDDSNDLEPLTPFHFLTGRTLMELPDMTTRRLVGNKSTSTTMTLRRRWYYQRKILRHLWQRWRKEYLVNFNNRQKWKTQKLELNIGDIVLLCEDSQTRSNWPMERILELHPSSDGMKRSALVKTAAGTLVRSIRKLQLIEPAAV
ncbi:hypothetical protein T4E_10779 [Trichinella pseudospiralis]|uniref:Integrase catalytic domain-containing protein n=3 Tax=Trichinella pseudospiralis TaxID=6337 RepID=A0A0V0YH86_TRIPS|nr:hypothetical protein T4E_10779 [Trichinella pseudospiralis]